MKGLFFAGLLLANLNAYSADLSNVYKSLKDGEYEKVISSLESIKSTDKKFLSTKFYLLGLSYSRLQNFPMAIANYKLAVSEGNNANDLWYELGQALYAENELQLSRKAFFRSAKGDYNRAQSNYYIGHISQLLDDHKNAKKFFEEILKDPKAELEMQQVGRFQLAESLLQMARMKADTATYVEKYILPQMEIALKTIPKNETARDIERRIVEIQKEFGLDPALMRNGRPRPDSKPQYSFTQSFTYDSNFTLTNDLPENISTSKDTFIIESVLGISTAFDFKRRFIIRPSLDLTKTSHTDRDSASVYASDGYNINPKLRTSYEHKAFSAPASLLLDVSYEYQAEDRLAQKSVIFNNRTTSFTVGERFKYFQKGETTFKIKNKYFRSYSESLHNDSVSFSIDQILIHNKALYVILFLHNEIKYINAESNNVSSNTLRFDYIKPNFFSKTNLSLGLSNTWQTYEDTTKDEVRGVETTLSANMKLSRQVRKFFSVDLEHIYTKNSSDLETSNYSKNETTLSLNLSL
ncbi:tetratricopeptide repeat protein [Bacteriovorax sp. Seq25_V]|uniref:tetratricopeptide repeat protein n=1 Tax=Bacteriovorax sp. Seq25_V TaxID=1201288 RepID=UPI00038A0406|nr:tetratricopeptide repeat protein [Bacteriovorax sp. Seq25_V]EQC46265.1 tetratricopeptide repeat protein [Bacteriovorax sp. Seq25_V]